MQFSNQYQKVYVRKDRKHLKQQSKEFTPASESKFELLEVNNSTAKYYRKKSFDVEEFFSERNDNSTECHSDGQNSESNLSECGNLETHMGSSYMKVYVKKAPVVKVQNTRDIKEGDQVEIVLKEGFDGFEIMEHEGDVIKYCRPKVKANELVA